MKRKYLSLLVIIFVVTTLSAQNKGLDTILLKYVESNFPIVAKISDLPFGQWNYHDSITIPPPSYCSPERDKVLYIRQICTEDYSLSYLEKDGIIRLNYLLLKKHKSFKISYDGLIFCHKTTLDDVIKHYNYSDDNIEHGVAPLLIGRKIRICRYYLLSFYTGENDCSQIQLVFNKHKRLIIIELDFFLPP